MEKQVLPIHGDQHCPGGPDPIPCLGGRPHAWMRWIGSEAVPADTLSNPAVVGTPDAPYEEGYVYDPSGLAGLSVDLDSGNISFDVGVYYVWAGVEWNGTGSAGETLAAVIDYGASGSFSTDRVSNMVIADSINQNWLIPVSRFIQTANTNRTVRALVYHSDAGGNDIGAVYIFVVQIHSANDGEFVTP